MDKDCGIGVCLSVGSENKLPESVPGMAAKHLCTLSHLTPAHCVYKEDQF